MGDERRAYTQPKPAEERTLSQPPMGKCVSTLQRDTSYCKLPAQIGDKKSPTSSSSSWISFVVHEMNENLIVMCRSGYGSCQFLRTKESF